jgi:acyl-CoA thioester hydrolase
MDQAKPGYVRIDVAWGEMDAFGHVNNVAYFRYLESSRVAFCRALGWMPEAGKAARGVWPILHSAQIRFRAPVEYPDTLELSAWPTALDEDRFTLNHEMVSRRLGRVVAQGWGVIVSYDFALKAKAPLPVPVRDRLAELARTAADRPAIG